MQTIVELASVRHIQLGESERGLVAFPLFSCLLLLVSVHPIGRHLMDLNAVDQERGWETFLKAV